MDSLRCFQRSCENTRAASLDEVSGMVRERDSARGSNVEQALSNTTTVSPKIGHRDGISGVQTDRVRAAKISSTGPARLERGVVIGPCGV